MKRYEDKLNPPTSLERSSSSAAVQALINNTNIMKELQLILTALIAFAARYAVQALPLINLGLVGVGGIQPIPCQ